MAKKKDADKSAHANDNSKNQKAEPNEDEEPNFDDPEGYVDPISEEGNLYQYMVWHSMMWHMLSIPHLILDLYSSIY